ncbi:VOC family protein [Salegentibacter maritimus]|uniref:VOC family protein n=1 Tax=Salegentibacter maritimus TaxID=2794347 RepID=UPI0018E4536A|nr:VOC family protein [Salegentibacter maritimus]MBI6116563.1 VOC family protein [Salegentibacter maritimus]
MKQQITSFLTFQKSNAEQAMNFYVDVFNNSKVIEVQRYGNDGAGKEGTLMRGVFELNGKQFICSDSFIQHKWDFTPAVSNWVECETKEELNRLYKTLSESGDVKMPLDNYGFSKLFAFVEDKFGLSWQLNLE